MQNTIVLRLQLQLRRTLTQPFHIIPLRSADTELQNTIAQHHQRREKVTWNHQFHCARSSRTFHAKKRRRLRPSRAQTNFSPQRNLRLAEKDTMFRANPNIQIASVIHENEAFVRGFLQNPRVEDVKKKLSCETSFKFH